MVVVLCPFGSNFKDLKGSLKPLNSVQAHKPLSQMIAGP